MKRLMALIARARLILLAEELRQQVGARRAGR
jgi:hypothetical protein